MADSQQERYVLQTQLGAGAMGEVWLATDTLLNRPVAIKYLKSTQESVPKQFFLSEARMLASLNHPNITLIYDAVFDEAQNRFYLVMEYVEGKPLSDLVENWSGPLPLEIILEVTIGILQALQYAHDHGIVHRDIKPANVMIQEDGVKLTDFGVAGLMSLLTEGSDYIVGTPAYMSPEQIEGRTIDGRADLYSLGMMLFEMASGGYRPFEYADQDELFEAHLQATPYALREFVPDAPLALDHTITRLLAKKPDDRYPSAGVVLEIFNSIQTRHKFSQAHLQLLDPETKPLVGRADELAQMEAIWAETEESATPRLLVVQGEMGIGKSRLVAEFLGRHVVDEGFVAVVGQCDESGIPYAPFAEILATIFNKGLAKSVIAQNQVDQLLDHIPSLARLLNIPEISVAKDALSQSRQQATATSSGLWQALSDKVSTGTSNDLLQPQWQFFATVITILTDLDPAVLFLEDANFLDEASVALTRFLIWQGQLPLLIIAACRDTGEAIPWLDSLSANEKVVITLPPLPTPAVKEQLINLRGGSVSDELAGLMKERSRGNPFHLEEITRQLIDSQELYQDEKGEWHYVPPKELEIPADSFLPKSVLNTFARRIEKLPAGSREALALATLVEPGAEFDFDIWLTLLGGESQMELAQETLDEALKQRLLRRTGPNRYIFRPIDVVRVLAATVPETRQRDLHRQVAKILHQRQADPILVGHHYEQAGLVTEAARYLEAAGAKAMATNAIHAALAYYNRAVTLVESQSAYKALGNLYRRNGEQAHSIRAFRRALQLARQAGHTADQAQILNGLALTLWLYDHYKEAYQYASAVLKLAGISKTERAIAQSHLGMISWLVGRLSEAETWYQKAIQALLNSDNQAALAEAYYWLGRVHLAQGKLTEARTVCQRSLEIRQTLNDRPGEGHCLTGLSQVAIEQGDFAQALSLLNSAQQLFEQVHDQRDLVAVHTNRGRASLYQGRPEEAMPLLSQALRLTIRLGKRNAYVLSDIYLLIAWGSLIQGEISRARAAADDALKLVKGAGNQVYIALTQAMLAQIYVAQGDLSTAETMYQKALALFDQVDHRPGLLRTLLNYARFLAQQGQTARATTLEQEARDEAARLGMYLPGN